jgi:hypothetical protein
MLTYADVWQHREMEAREELNKQLGQADDAN